ncbi:transposase [Salipiger bermudensis]|nr:transposase [Salipiger bermudensis]MBN9677262.1 transposase [Salipiger bermudensis]
MMASGLQHLSKADSIFVTQVEHALPQLAQLAQNRRLLDAFTSMVRNGEEDGQTEGQINRLKMLKRQMYGAAGYRPPSCTSSEFGMKASQKLGRTQDCLPIHTLRPRIVSSRHDGGRIILNVYIK